MPKANWRKRLEEARELAKQGAALTFDRITILAEIYQDPAFLNDCDRRGVDPIEEINDEVADTAMTFTTLRSMLAEFPRREDWLNRRLQDMAASIIVNRREVDNKKPREAGWKQRFEELQEQYDALERKFELTDAQLSELRAVVTHQTV